MGNEEEEIEMDVDMVEINNEESVESEEQTKEEEE